MGTLLIFFLCSKSLCLISASDMAYLIRSLINLYLNVCRCAATIWNAKLNKSLKMVSLLAKIVFMSKYLGSSSNETQKFGIYKEGQKIPHELRSRCQLNYIDSYLAQRIYYLLMCWFIIWWLIPHLSPALLSTLVKSLI